MSSDVKSVVKKFLKQVGNVMAVNTLATAASELGKVVWPKVKEKLNGVMDKASEINETQKARKDLNDLVKSSAQHYKRAKTDRVAEKAVLADDSSQTAADTPPLADAEPPVDAKFAP